MVRVVLRLNVTGVPIRRHRDTVPHSQGRWLYDHRKWSEKLEDAKASCQWPEPPNKQVEIIL